jgi:beta-glucosidase-like glycosyl hydrolase
MSALDPARTARLLFPALRWNADSGFDHERETIELALRLGVGGFCIFGGEAGAVADLTAEVQRRSAVPLLVASDMERGAGQQLPQATPLPPLAAIGALDDLDVTRAAGALTAREALAVGVNWVLAPVADVDLEARNPIVGSRAFGTDPDHVARHVAAWVEGCSQAGALCCAKHFPGHGRTVHDSHATLPRVTCSRAELEQDLTPFRAAVHAGASAIMTAHVVYDALDGATAATLSPTVLTGLLRRELAYDGLIASDAVVMEGNLQAAGGSEADAAMAALRAGCDALLYPGDLAGLALALAAAPANLLDPARVDDALRRIDRAAQQAAAATAAARPAYGRDEDRAWADDVALRCIAVGRGAPAVAAAVDLISIDDDLGGPYAPPSRDVFPAVLRGVGIDVVPADAPSGERPVVVALYSDIRAWKPEPGPSPAAREKLAFITEREGDAVVVFFGHRRFAVQVAARHVLAAWGGERLMQRAAARWLAGHRQA